jgi:hypothetical protein
MIEQTLWSKTIQVGDNLEQYISSIQFGGATWKE